MISHSLTTNVKNTEFQKFFTCCALPFKSCYKNNSRNVCQSDNRKENQKVVTLKKNRNTIFVTFGHTLYHYFILKTELFLSCFQTQRWRLGPFTVARSRAPAQSSSCPTTLESTTLLHRNPNSRARPYGSRWSHACLHAPRGFVCALEICNKILLPGTLSYLYQKPLQINHKTEIAQSFYRSYKKDTML